MTDVNEKVLQILPGKVFDYNLNMYSIALEGWRRGLNLTFFAGTIEGIFDIQLSLKDVKKEYHFAISKADKSNDKKVVSFTDKLSRKDDVPKSIIDYYFPETINNQKSTLHFDFDKISDALRKGLLTEIIVSDTDNTEMITKCFLAYGDVNKIQFNNWLQQNARNLNLSGSVETLNTKVRSILIYGQQDRVKKFIQLLDKNVPLLQSDTQPGENFKKQGFEIIS